MKRRLLVSLLVVLPASAGAQIPGPMVATGDLEVGIGWRRVDRELSYEGKPYTYTRDAGTLVLRYGITESATVWGELLTDADPFEGETIYYTVGGGLMTGVWSHGRVDITTSIYYAENLGRRRGESLAKWWEQVIEWNLPVSMRFGEDEVRGMVWVGPSLSALYTRVHAPPNSKDLDPERWLGAAFGGRATLWRHFVVQAGATWVGGGLQSHAMLAYRL